MQDPMLERVADNTGQAVVAVEYRLAPEHPYPAGPDDCEEAAVWLVQNGKKEFGTDALTIGGESAGGHLTVLTILRMRDRHGFTGFRGANIVHGAFDLSMTPSQRLETISTDEVWVDDMVAAMTPRGLGPVVPSAS